MDIMLQSKQIEEEHNNFKNSFKHFKCKKPIPDFSSVLNLHQFNHSSNPEVCVQKSCNLSPELEIVRQNLGIRNSEDWKIYSLSDHPGLLIICNAFTSSGAMIWIKKCLQQFTESPFKTNLSNLGLSSDQAWWLLAKESLLRDQNPKFINQLRWATMGYHHNWDTKVYSMNEKSPVPDDLDALCKLFLCAVGENYRQFKAEAAIVNYYPPGTTLSPHTDHSEPCKEAPLFSFSFGRSGIFLIGGKDRNITPTPIYLHHGDVMIMSGDSRLCYHAIPRIISTEDLASGNGAKNEQDEFINWYQRILWNYKNSQESKTTKNISEINLSDTNIEDYSGSSALYEDGVNEKFMDNEYLMEKVDLNYEDLLATITYIKKVRININVRQVND